jgi:hypothetical protein
MTSFFAEMVVPLTITPVAVNFEKTIRSAKEYVNTVRPGLPAAAAK